MNTGVGRGRGNRNTQALLESLKALSLSSKSSEVKNPSSSSSSTTNLSQFTDQGDASRFSSPPESGIFDQSPSIGRGKKNLSAISPFSTSSVGTSSSGCFSTSSISDMPEIKRSSGRGKIINTSHQLFVQTPLKLEQTPPVNFDHVKLSQSASIVKPKVIQGDVAVTQLAKSVLREEAATTHKEKAPTIPITKLGETGHSVDIAANYLRLSVKPGHGAFEYYVRFTPEVDSKDFKIRMLREHAKELGRDLTFDGQILYLPKKLSMKMTFFKSKHPVESSLEILLEITFIKEKKLSEMIHLYNILFKKIMIKLKYKRIGRDNFDPEQSFIIPQHKLEVWPGYITTVDDFEGGLMLNIDPSHKVLRTTSTLSEIQELSYRSDNSRNAIKNALIGKAVITKYSCKLYTIDDVDFSVNPMSFFERNDGEKITYVDYYKKSYDSQIYDLQQPLLISRCNRKLQKPTPNEVFEERLIYLVPELCTSTGLTDNMRQDFTLMKDLAQFMKITPNQRYQALRKFVTSLNNNPEAVQLLANWGLALEPLPVSLTARTLPPEVIRFGNNKNMQQSGNSSVDWSKESSMYPVIMPVDIIHWVVIHTERDARSVKEFCDCIMHCAKPIGIKISPPRMIGLRSDRTEEYVNALRRTISPQLQIVVCVCPTSRDDRYSAIKKICCVDNPIASQIINGATMRKKNARSIAQKILLQMNCKLGGSLWAVSIPYKRLMVIGIDVYHSADRAQKKSVCGFVASYNDSLTKWYSRVCFQSSHQEIIDKIKVCFVDALELYLETNGVYPDRIIIYRDGVGQGQFNVCLNHELPQIESCFKLVGENYNPSLTFVIVQKRHSTRLFGNQAPGGGEYNNPSPGTIIDNTVTRKYLYDFYVVSHKARQGSLVPTHYIVLKDTSDMKPDHVQRLTYKLCHLYFNWAGTVRVPAPCQYAHKLASLMGASVKKEHSIVLSKNLFFL